MRILYIDTEIEAINTKMEVLSLLLMMDWIRKALHSINQYTVVVIVFDVVIIVVLINFMCVSVFLNSVSQLVFLCKQGRGHLRGIDTYEVLSYQKKKVIFPPSS